MSYRIEYRKEAARFSARLPFLTVICFFVFLFLVDRNYPEGAELIRALFCRARHSGAVSALNQFARELPKAEKIRDVFSVFHPVLWP